MVGNGKGSVGEERSKKGGKVVRGKGNRMEGKFDGRELDWEAEEKGEDYKWEMCGKWKEWNEARKLKRRASPGELERRVDFK